VKTGKLSLLDDQGSPVAEGPEWLLGLYTPNEVRQVVNVTSRQLRYWIDEGFFTPHKKSAGQGARTYFNFINVFYIYLINLLFERGVNLKVIKRIMEDLETRSDPYDFYERVYITDGADYVEVRNKSKIKSFDRIVLKKPFIYSIKLSLVYDELIKKIEKA
jgi:DNA-binding transcriptional MerR regulator